MGKKYFTSLLVVFLLLVLAAGGCGRQGADDSTTVGPAPEAERGEADGSADPDGEGRKAAPFRGQDFLGGQEVEFDPDTVERPALVAFFSPG